LAHPVDVARTNNRVLEQTNYTTQTYMETDVWTVGNKCSFYLCVSNCV